MESICQMLKGVHFDCAWPLDHLPLDFSHLQQLSVCLRWSWKCFKQLMKPIPWWSLKCDGLFQAHSNAADIPQQEIQSDGNCNPGKGHDLIWTNTLWHCACETCYLIPIYHNSTRAGGWNVNQKSPANEDASDFTVTFTDRLSFCRTSWFPLPDFTWFALCQSWLNMIERHLRIRPPQVLHSASIDKPKQCVCMCAAQKRWRSTPEIHTWACSI